MMKPLDYLLKNKDIFFEDACEENNFTSEQAELLFTITLSYIERLSNVRHKLSLTEQIVNELKEKSVVTSINPDAPRSIEYDFIMLWLTKAVANDPTYQWSMIRLAQVQNRQASLPIFDLPEKFLSKEELKQLIEEEKPAEVKRKYFIPDNNQLIKVFDVSGSSLDCDYLTFRIAVEAANFTQVGIKRHNFVRDLVFRLSGIMGQEWYSEICRTMKWTKSACSGQKQKLEMDTQTKKLDKILPRPKRNR